ncbi:RIC1-domain-containing protein [Phycomyces blakesleeanus]|uniref:RIC1-domain-containing protein n=1 Tax=Phycomyces blakesleeanus TaxID=4837 RepID=A0ABR3B966_PHYBL
MGIYWALLTLAYLPKLTSPTSPSSQLPRGSNTLTTETHFGGDTASFAPASPSYTEKVHWKGVAFHGIEEDILKGEEATCVAINAKFSLIAVGTKSGLIRIYSANHYLSPPEYSHTLELETGGATTWGSINNKSISRDAVQSLAWTSDGYAISVGYEYRGLAIWSVYGTLLSSMSELEEIHLQDTYIHGVYSMFWGPGNYQLFVLDTWGGGDYQENNTTTIDPDAVAWTHILYPTMYITDHWPIRCSSVSRDGKYIAIAGKRGLAHYNTISGRWKMFGNQQQEKSFLIRLYSRDSNLDNAYILHTEVLHQIPNYITICGNFLLVYTSDNVLSIYSIFIDQLNTLEDAITANIILLVDGKNFILCPSMGDSEDVERDEIHNQYEIHMLSEKTEYYWIGRKSVANLLTSLWVVDGKGVKLFTNLLRGEDCGFSTFGKDIYESEPSTPTTPGLFTARGYSGRPFSLGYRIGPEPDSPSASVNMEGFSQWRTGDLKFADADAIYIPLDFYPHSVLLEKGVIVGIEQNMVYKDLLGFMVYKITTKTHLFIHHILRHLLKRDLEEDAVVFARVYEKLVYFSHALEILLHTVLEEESGQSLGDDAILPLVIKFLDQFPHALDVIVSCARKTEVALWDHLFSAVGKPKDLFEVMLIFTFLSFCSVLLNSTFTSFV